MNENDKILLVKYITNQASEKEIGVAKYLISTSKEHEDFYVQYYETWQNSIHYNIEAIDAEKAYQSFLANSVQEKPLRKPVITLSRLAIAASIILICAFGANLYINRISQPESKNAQVVNEIKVPKGSTRKTILPDGTVVWINAGSYLKFEEGYGKTSRTVYLDGEAYFDIAKNKIPFILKTNHHTIRDIGTVFNVKAYSDDSELETAVIEGEVSVEGRISLNAEKSEKISVREKQVLKLNYAPLEAKNTAVEDIDLIEATVQKINVSQLEVYTGWTEDLLVFEGKTFFEISKIMERRYDVKIIMDDPKLRNYLYTGSFKNIDHIDKALQILKETTDIDYSKKGNTIIIFGSELKN